MENRQRFVRGGGRRCFGTYSTVTQICRTCAVNKNTRWTTGTSRDMHHGHYNGTYPWVYQGRVLRC